MSDRHLKVDRIIDLILNVKGIERNSLMHRDIQYLVERVKAEERAKKRKK